MQFEYMVVAEGFPADFARIRFFPGMRPRMHLQLLATRESLLAHATYVRFFPGMRPHMDHELSRLYKRL